MPWAPELFSAPVLERWLEQRRLERVRTVPYFDGLLTGELGALVESFAGEPELHHPVRGRIKGRRAFEEHVTETIALFRERNAAIDDVQLLVTEPRGCEEVVLHLDGESGRVDLPVAIVIDHPAGGRIEEMRIYFGSRPLNGGLATRPPLLQPDPALRLSDVVDEHQRALAAGDVDAVTATFEPDGHVRAGGLDVHRGRAGLRAFYEQLFSGGGGIELEHCALVDDGRSCALECNVVRRGATPLPPQAGLAVYVRGESGRLAAARVYGDADPVPGTRSAAAIATRTGAAG